MEQSRYEQNAIEDSFAQGREEGIEIGIEKGIEKVAINAFKMGTPIDEIAKFTGLTPEQIIEILKTRETFVKK